MKIKRILSFITALSVCFSSYCILNDKYEFINETSVYAEETVLTYENLTYTADDNEVTITGCTDDTTELIIPAEIDGMPVTEIGRMAFIGKENITSVQFPDSLVKIDTMAFSSCTGLTSISIPDSVTSVGDKFCYDCINLKEVKLSKNMTYISDAAFLNTAIESIELHEGLLSIWDDVFKNTPLKEAVLPSTLNSIGITAFENCTQLESINLENVHHIEGNAFRNCEKLKEVSLSPKLTTFDSVFTGCTSLKEIIIPEGVKTFTGLGGCTSLEYLYLPSTLVSVYGGITSCPNLKSIQFYDQREYNPFYAIFYQCTALEYFIFPTGVYEVRNGMFNGCTSLEYVELTNQITSIDKNAFTNCPELDYIYIPDTVTHIDSTAFGYVTDEGTGNYVKSDKDIVIITDSANSVAAQFAQENGFTTVTSDSLVIGDMNIDEVIDIRDITAMKQYLMNDKTTGSIQYVLGDITQDGYFDIFDLMYFKNMALNISSLNFEGLMEE